MSQKNQPGFTLIEVLLVIAILAILAAATIVFINPAKQLAHTRDKQRSADVYTLLSAIHQYAADHDGAYPETITMDNLEICLDSTNDCSNLHDLSELTNNQSYLVGIPTDPSCFSVEGVCVENGTGYFLQKTDSGRITISAPNTEVESTISVTR